MHTIHHIDAIVLHGVNHGEASRVLSLFTREQGLVYVHAQGLREMKSKLRYILQNFSHVQINLVRGRHGWRVTSAELISSLTPPTECTEKEIRLKAMARISWLLLQIMPREEKTEALYNDVLRAFEILGTPSLPHAFISNVEIVVVMRVLSSLGYWGGDDLLTPFIGANTIDTKVIEDIEGLKKHAVQEVNKSLRETHLI